MSECNLRTDELHSRIVDNRDEPADITLSEVSQSQKGNSTYLSYPKSSNSEAESRCWLPGTRG